MKLFFLFENINLMLKKSPIIHRLVYGAFWALMGAGIFRFFSMITNIFVARIIGRENFGVLGMIDSTLGMFGLFAGFAMGSTMTKYIAELRAKNPERVGRILTLTKTISFVTGGITVLVIFVISPWLARVTLNRIELSPLLQAGAIFLFANAVGNVLIGSLAGFEAFKKIAKVYLLQGVATPLLIIPFCHYYGVQGVISGWIVVAGIGYLLWNRALAGECRQFNITYRNFDLSSFKEWRILWNFSFPATVSALLVIPVMWVTNTILVNQANGYGELGLFNAANQWRQVIILFPQILMAVMLPIFAEIYGRQTQNDFIYALKLNLKVTWMIALPMTILMIAMRNPLAALFGSQFLVAAPLITILVITAFLNIINNVVGTALMGAGRMWIGAAFNLGWAIVLVIAAAFLVPIYGGLGLALAYLVAYSMHTIWQMTYVDLKMAPSAILNQWKLLVVSIATIIPVCLGEYIGTSNSISNLFFIALAFFPLLKVGIDFFRKKNLVRF